MVSFLPFQFISQKENSSSTAQVQMARSCNTGDRLPPMPAPTAKDSITPKYYRAMTIYLRSFVLRYVATAAMPLRRLPMHMVEA